MRAFTDDEIEELKMIGASYVEGNDSPDEDESAAWDLAMSFDDFKPMSDELAAAAEWVHEGMLEEREKHGPE